MISVEEAKKLVCENVFPLSVKEIGVSEALDFFLAESIIAPISVPSFNQSAMDGYAFKYENIAESIKIIDEIPAGDIREIKVNNGEGVRIFTGSKVPIECDTVVMQELTEVNDNQLLVRDSGLKLGGNIRTKGGQIEQGNIALEKGTKITPATIGLLSALGITKIKAHQSPRVTIIATGDELIKPGNDLLEGQIFESNTFMLKAALNKLNIEPQIILVEDDKEKTQQAISDALINSELLLLSGGISVGDYDFVKEGLESNEVEEVFYKVKQKPGKPLYFGRTNSCYVFALPGNPAAALTCFYQYVYTSINIMKGNKQVLLSSLKLPLKSSLNKKEGRAVFYKAHTDYKTVTILEGQGSDMLKSMAIANCFIYVNSETSYIEENDMVEVQLFP